MGNLYHMMILGRLSWNYFGTEQDSQKLGAGCIKADITTGQGKSLRTLHKIRQHMLSTVMSDQDILGAMTTHYEPRIQNCLLSVKLNSTQAAFVFLTKLRSLENSREQYRSAR